MSNIPSNLVTLGLQRAVTCRQFGEFANEDQRCIWALADEVLRLRGVGETPAPQNGFGDDALEAIKDCDRCAAVFVKLQRARQSAPKTTPPRIAAFEREAPHCPTCSCGMSPETQR